jgi:hypothetical protein
MLSEAGYFAANVDLHFRSTGGNVQGERLAARPTDPELGWGIAQGEDLYRTVLGPIATSAVNLAHWSEVFAMLYSHLSAISERVSGRAFQPDPQTGFSADIFEQTHGRSILCDGQIDAAIAVKVGDGSAALLAINHHSALRAGYGAQAPMSIAF